MYIHFDIKDVRWAIVLMGALNNAKQEPFSQVNKPFKASFEPCTNTLKYLSSYFDAVIPGCKSYALPNDEQCKILDYYAANKSSKELLERHGIQQAPNVHPLYLPNLAHNTLLMTHGISSEPGFFFPAPRGSVLKNIAPVDAVVEKSEYIPLAKAFCKGLNQPCENVLVYDDVDEFIAIQSIFNSKVVLSRPYHTLQYVLRAQYKGFDHLANNIPSIAITDSTVNVSNRYLISWNGQIPSYDTESIEAFENKGKAWFTRVKYDFDHRKFYKDLANGK